MSVLVIRHGFSEANDRNNFGTLAFANAAAPLMEQGKDQALALKYTLSENYGIVTAEASVATSELRRTQETAETAGFQRITRYAVLNEVAHGIVLPELRGLLDQRMLPQVAIDTAESILDEPPSEAIWITHGLVIASLCKVLGVYQHEARFIPRFCEIRELPLPSISRE